MTTRVLVLNTSRWTRSLFTRSSRCARLMPSVSSWQQSLLPCQAECMNGRLPSRNQFRQLSIIPKSSSNDTPSRISIQEAPAQPEHIASISVSEENPSSWSGDLLVIGVFESAFETKDEKTTIVDSDLLALDAQFDGALSDIVSLYEFSGKKGSSQVVRAGKSAKFIALVGLGSIDAAAPVVDWGCSVWQTFGSAIASAGKSSKAKTAAAAVIGSNSIPSDNLPAIAGRVANGIINGAYESTRFKSKPAPGKMETVELLFVQNSAQTAQNIEKGIAMARGALMTRFLVEAPANVCTPTYLAEAAATIASQASDCMKLEVLEKEECEKLGMGCFLGVAEASLEPPKFIHLTYSPKGEVKRKIAIVGKGLTFDSGGYNLKAGAGSMIEMMKFDMGGSGATLGAARAISDIKPDGVEIHFIIASCENMIHGKGLRPGDILVASNGKTVEVNNTDAEGRLTLADAILFAQNQCKVDAIVDIATLTGACMIALGGGIGGMYSSTDQMGEELIAASRNSGEKIWKMPLEESYLEQLKSSVADLKNTGGRMGGSITAALFLKEFIDTDKVAWSHLDIAGPVWDDKLGGATGFGAQLLTEWAISQGK